MKESAIKKRFAKMRAQKEEKRLDKELGELLAQNPLGAPPQELPSMEEIITRINSKELKLVQVDDIGLETVVILSKIKELPQDKPKTFVLQLKADEYRDFISKIIPVPENLKDLTFF